MSWLQAQEHKSIPYTGLSLFQSFHWMHSKALSIPTAASPHPSIYPHVFQEFSQLKLLHCPRVSPGLRACHAQLVTHEANINAGNPGCSHTWGRLRTLPARRKPLQPMTPSITLNSSGREGGEKEISQGKRSLNSRSCRQTHHPLSSGFLL